MPIRQGMVHTRTRRLTLASASTEDRSGSMTFVVRYRGMVVGVYDNFIDAYEAIDPRDDVSMYELVIVEGMNLAVTEMKPKTIKVILAGQEF
jgi:hypothetical protein